jgi:hypothetical protein
MEQPRRSPHDFYETETTDHQAETETLLLKHIPPLSGSPSLFQRDAHLQFLIRNLVQGLPSRYISQDASQPWLLYWTLQSFSVMGVGMDPNNKQKCVAQFQIGMVWNVLPLQGHRHYYGMAASRRRIWRWTGAGCTFAPNICFSLCASHCWKAWPGWRMGSDRQVSSF